MRQRALEASAAAHEAQGRLDEALRRVEQSLYDNPLQEQRHRDAMRLLAALGRREEALAQFERCRSLLELELGLKPMDQTLALEVALRASVAPETHVPVSYTHLVAHAPSPPKVPEPRRRRFRASPWLPSSRRRRWWPRNGAGSRPCSSP